jgi:hypothetical protein
VDCMPSPGTETIFFPHDAAAVVLDSIEAHSWVTLEGVRFCFGVLWTCPYCRERMEKA